ncbi:MAG: HEAT repeat domain-containing protein, partial [Gemmataceae bacterium]
MQHLPDSQSGPALQLLTDAMSHTQTQVRELAIVAIAELPTPPSRRVAALAVGLQDASARVRRRAARAIADQGPAAHAALPLLLKGLQDADPSVRRDCAGAVGRLGATAQAASKLLVALLDDEETRTRAVIAVALKRIGKPAVPALIAGFRNSFDFNFQNRCATLLRVIAGEEPKIRELLQEFEAERLDDAMLATQTPGPGDTLTRMNAAATV